MTKLFDIEGGQDGLQVIRSVFPMLSPGRLRDLAIVVNDGTGFANVDCSQGDFFAVDASIGIVTIRTPLRSPNVGQEIIFLFQNFTAGAFPAVTWAAGYRVEAGWLGPAANKLKCIGFIRIGNTWVQMGPTVDV